MLFLLRFAPIGVIIAARNVDLLTCRAFARGRDVVAGERGPARWLIDSVASWPQNTGSGPDRKACAAQACFRVVQCRIDQTEGSPESDPRLRIAIHGPCSHDARIAAPGLSLAEQLDAMQRAPAAIRPSPRQPSCS